MGRRGKMALSRRCIQLASALIYNANLAGFRDGSLYRGQSKGLCVPGLNCYSCPGAVASCPLGTLQNAISRMPQKAPYYIAGFLLLTGLVLGRIVCGFLCPFGLVQELLHKIPGPKIKKSLWTRRLSYLKYIILAVFVVIVPLWYAYAKGYPLPAFCKYICPAGTLEGGWPMVLLREDFRQVIGALFGWKTLVCVAVLVSCVFCYRAFCRFVCPLGAIYSLFARVALIAVRVDKSLCNDCGACVRRCPMDVRRVGDRECVQCGHCRASCPQNAIYFGLEKRSWGISGKN